MVTVGAVAQRVWVLDYIAAAECTMIVVQTTAVLAEILPRSCGVVRCVADLFEGINDLLQFVVGEIVSAVVHKFGF